jgi:ankyrin repeat protein
MTRSRTTLFGTSVLAGLLLAGSAHAQKPSGDALLQAAQDGLSAQATALVKQGAPVGAVDSTGETALAWAVMHGDGDLAAALLKAHANPNTADASGVTPLIVAVQNGQPEMVKLLLDKGANASVARMTGETALMLAVRAGSADIVSSLLDHHADVNAREPEFGQTALMWAAGQPDIVRLLLSHGADVKPVTKDWMVNVVNYTPTTATVGVTGIPWNNDGTYTVKAGGLNALIFAAQHDDLESARMLLDAGADVNRASADGTTPLLAALYHWRSPDDRPAADPKKKARAGLNFVSDYKLASLLMDRGAKPQAVDGAGYTPLHGALIGMQPAPVANRFAAPAKITQKPADPEGVAVVKRLLDLGADPNAATVYPTGGPVTQVRVNPAPPGSTPMHIAAQSTDTASLELLIAHGGDVNRLRKDGHTPFSVAAKSNSLPALKVMVAHGANVKMIYNPGDKLADTVEARAEERKNETVLHIAGAAGATDVIEYLVAQGVPTDVVNDHGETALQTADNQEVVRWKLTREGAVGKDGDLNAKRITETTDAFKKAMGIKTKVASK